jgi:protease-4
MSLETDLLLDRRRLKRRLVFWRVSSVILLVVAGLTAFKTSPISHTKAHIARLTVSGLITENQALTDAVDKLATDSNVKALIVRIDSPGGSVPGGEELHDAIARVAAHKPVVAVMQGEAASAGYMVAVSAQRIFAMEGTLTGSIGVLLESPEFSGLLSKLGIGAEVVRSGPLKDEPSMVRPISPAGRDVLQGIVNDMYDQFVTMVAKGRNMPPDKVRELGDGRPYTGRQALALGLIDQIGGEKDARTWLASQKGVSADLAVEDVSTSHHSGWGFSSQMGDLVTGLWKTVISQSLSLDGAWAVWHRFDN